MARTRLKSAKRKYLIVCATVLVIVILCYREWNRTNAALKERNHIEIPQGFSSYGIDVSHHQGEIDWDSLFASRDSIINFVYCKATEGVHHVDSKWEENRVALNKRKPRLGAYHFFLPNKDAKQQADHFLVNYNAKTNYLPPVIDIEIETDSDSELIENVSIWLDCVESRIKKRPIIYTSHHLYKKIFKGKLTGYTFWIANYNTNPSGLEDTNIVLWQYTDKGSLAGIEGDVDLNYSKILY